jgi:hypothetical protein
VLFAYFFVVCYLILLIFARLKVCMSLCENVEVKTNSRSFGASLELLWITKVY